MKNEKFFLFKPIDFGIKFEITLKILIVALFSSLLFGIAVYKLFESSLIMSEKKILVSYKALYMSLKREDPYHLSLINRALSVDEYWLLDKNFKLLRGEDTSNLLISFDDFKSTPVRILKKGVVFPSFKKIYVSIPLKNQRHLIVSKKLNSLNNLLIHLRKLILYYVILTTFLTIFLLNILLKSSIIRPLKEIIFNINEIKSGKRKKIKGHFLKEFNYLINNFNELLQQIEDQAVLLNDKIIELHELNKVISEYHQEMSKFEKFVSIGELSAGIAHEIGNPLNNIQGYLAIIKRNSLIIKDISLLDYIKRIERDVSRINNIVKNILDFSRKGESVNSVNLDIISSIDRVLDLITFKLKEKKIKVLREYCCESLFVKTDHGKLEQVLLNLLSNAVDSIEMEGTIKISVNYSTEVRDFVPESIFDATFGAEKKKRFIIISIIDDGIGISETELPHVFDPFFTTKAPGRGTGLGLSVSLNIMRELGGTITLKSRKAEGTTARVILPL